MVPYFAKHRAVLGLVILVTTALFLLGATRLLASPTAGLAPGCDAGATDAQAINESVAAAIAQTPELASDPQHVWRIHSVCQQGAWAYVFVKGYAAGTNAPLSAPSLVALVRQTTTGWQAVLPTHPNEYNQALADSPTTLMPPATKAMLSQPASGASPAITSPTGAYFSGFALRSEEHTSELQSL